MNKLYPIATADTRQYFVDPSHLRPNLVEAEGYVNGEETAFIKPGVIPDLMKLCKPADIRFSITEEPDINTMAISKLIVGLRGVIPTDEMGKRYHLVGFEDLDIRLNHVSPGQSSIKGTIAITVTGNETTMTGLPVSWMFEKGHVIHVPIEVTYSRGSRRFELSGEGTYDNDKPVIYGIKLNLDHKDSKTI